MTDLDLLIEGGTLIDGTGAACRKVDISKGADVTKSASAAAAARALQA